MFSLVKGLIAAYKEGRYSDFIRLSAEFITAIADVLDMGGLNRKTFGNDSSPEEIDEAVTQIREFEGQYTLLSRQTSAMATAIDPTVILGILQTIRAILEWWKSRHQEG
jgi:hypothetical protein